MPQNLDFNFQKTPYRAICIQWNGNNYDAIFEMLSRIAPIRSVQLFRECFIIVRYHEGITSLTSTLTHGDWAIKGEDGEPRFYKSDRFPSSYQALLAQHLLE
jgi:hypothetical protein